MHLIHYLYTALVARLLTGSRDRGDSPVPSAIIIAGLAVIAGVLLVWVIGLARGYMNQAPTDLPDLGAG